MTEPTVKISSGVFKALGAGPTEVLVFRDALQEACTQFEINRPVRIAAFLAQVAHESYSFKNLQENLFYTTPERLMQVYPSRVKSLEQAKKLVKNPKELANVVYSDRLGNGSASSDDGWNYRGRGLFQLTGRKNYQAAQDALGHPYVTKPELVALPLHAALTAAWFWKTHECNDLADRHLFSMITRCINGPAMLGHEERMALQVLASNALS